MTPSEIIKRIKDEKIAFIDFKFNDFPGTWQNFTVPSKWLDADAFEEGFGFDGSSIRGWREINESDMLIMPDPATAFLDPFCEYPTLSLTCTILDPITRENYSRDPRTIALKAEEYLKSTGVADTAFFGPEAEFFIFDNVRFGGDAHYAFYELDSVEGIWNSESDEVPNLGHRPRFKEGYFPVPPTDSLQDIRSEMVAVLQACGVDVEAHHHEVATAGQCEIDMRFNTLVRMADHLMVYKYVVKNVARRHGKSACFMPKPLFGDNGSGMHVHSSLWKGGKPLFAGDHYAGLSQMALYYIGGILKHAPALCALCNPTTNSYRRLVPGYEAPVNLAYSQRNRSAAVRIPMYSASPKAKRVEYRPPDPSCNPYLAFSAILMAGLDGILNRIEPGDPLDKNIYDLPPEELAMVPTVPGSLRESLNILEKDHEFLLRGDVFTQDVIEGWLSYKRTKEVDPVNLRPHPHEFHLYYDV
ncbi:type I glutamate--ammonia ligase [bacterium]|nr:type I glutamate--ammonia ligase [bacterium]